MDYWLDGTNSGNDEDTTQGTGQGTGQGNSGTFGLGGNGLMDWGGPADTLAPKPAREKTLGEWLYPDMKPSQDQGGLGFPQSRDGSGLDTKRRRVSAAGFDIDTGEYVGPDRYTPLGFNPDTGEPILPGQDPTPDNEPPPLYIPEALKDKHPAARVLWAVQTGQLPYLKGLPAIDENGDLHPAYTRAVGAGGMSLADGGDYAQLKMDGDTGGAGNETGGQDGDAKTSPYPILNGGGWLGEVMTMPEQDGTGGDQTGQLEKEPKLEKWDCRTQGSDSIRCQKPGAPETAGGWERPDPGPASSSQKGGQGQDLSIKRQPDDQGNTANSQYYQTGTSGQKGTKSFFTADPSVQAAEINCPNPSFNKTNTEWCKQNYPKKN